MHVICFLTINFFSEQQIFLFCDSNKVSTRTLQEVIKLFTVPGYIFIILLYVTKKFLTITKMLRKITRSRARAQYINAPDKSQVGAQWTAPSRGKLKSKKPTSPTACRRTQGGVCKHRASCCFVNALFICYLR